MFAGGLVAGEVFNIISSARCQVPATATHLRVGGTGCSAGWSRWGTWVRAGARWAGPEAYWGQSLDEAGRGGAGAVPCLLRAHRVRVAPAARDGAVGPPGRRGLRASAASQLANVPQRAA